ncbi:MAG TPA: M23 family peptidase [Hungateiclostridium thermocellum]|jgi:murein DD-endopeptidase MepM/ murein hydrolase activator NlpD|uniref:Peptidase M23 n=2 Tax=Acetivibrio thermocellus TaxID=1515 RepID=A3DG99_ACET2|nr:peptidoglycan DD-metalloendopeptidase family protein [Acetivibrio thermocellus]ABN52978.1 Peptidase M23 [Acetivibrio thermocellus ATCC 27405]ADU75444.1 Peptidase M23 [Acetivibrio thermocellus DSM 1313]ALX09444.1 Peptidase M23 [Acetivibrio thermocellus AD2]ANV77198.1 Peptidase M23 [Acetivibrio thermocellus DSM 2360]EIC04568.1 Peptidase M23 [Acetivibrio thermocellus YS]
MKKSSQRKESKYLSIVVIPHNTDEIKVFKISSVKYKLMALGAILLTMFICSGILITYLIYENRVLNEDRKKVIAVNNQQMNLITEREEIIQSYIRKVEEQDKLIKNFTTLYRDMTAKYIDGSMENVTASRSGLRDDRAFINDINKLKGILDKLEEINGDDADILSSLSETQSKLKQYIDSIPTLWPASGRISSRFGTRSDPFNFSQKVHEGIDIAADYGTTILASATGKVTLSDWYGNYGKCVIIDHGYGLSTLYGHCQTLLVKEGQTVKKGDKIATVGSTGRSTGPHLHFEVRLNGVPVDPLQYLDNK